ncbi:hypothetical protein PROPEN_04085 [Proteus penneri ATCC 35198]|nr:hypothetical protein PROPEN_04085 [Proteus penneri ATCC 35198]
MIELNKKPLSSYPIKEGDMSIDLQAYVEGEPKAISQKKHRTRSI